VALQEPYFYRNRGSQRDYMFRSIEDLYCNNFYPLSERIDYGLLVSERARNTFRHFRLSPTRARDPFKFLPLSDRVRLVTVSPMTFGEPYLTREEGDAAGLDQVDVVVLEGYNSGTFPSRPDHPFTNLLRSLIRRSIPIVLVTPDGLLPTDEPYKKQKIDGQDLPVLRLFGVIAETAGPLMAGVRGAIDDGEWQVPGESDSYKILLGRHKLLDETLRKRQADSPGILFSLLGNIVDDVEQKKRVDDGVEREWSQYSEMVGRLFAAAEKPLLLSMAVDPRRSGHKAHKKGDAVEAQEEEKRCGAAPFDETRSVLMREHFLWLLREIVRPFEMAGCGPDGMAILNEIGFIWGQQMFEKLTPDRESWKAPFSETASERDSEVRERLFDRARTKLARLSRMLKRHGVADVETKLGESSRRGQIPAEISLRVHWVKHGSISKPGELYRVQDYGDDERQFFAALRKGAELDLHDSECSEALERRFNRLFENGLGVQVSALDWFLIGIYKAAVCGILVELRFDPWTNRFAGTHSSNVSALRQSVTTRIQQSSREDSLDLEFLYAARD